MRSYPPDFEMVSAKDLASALAATARGYLPFAGGTDIMVLFNAGKLPVQPLVSIRKIPELSGISITRAFIEMGAAVTYTQLRSDPIVSKEFGLLAQAASWTGSIANQNRGTLGGNIANASPAADSAPVLLAYDAELKLVSAKSERWIPYSSFHLGYKSIALEPGELIAAIRFGRNASGGSQYGRKVGTRKAQAIAKVSMAAVATQHRNLFRIAVGSAAPIPMRCRKTEELLANEKLSPSVIERAKRLICEEISPISDIRSTRDYRLTVTENLLGEFLESLP